MVHTFFWMFHYCLLVSGCLCLKGFQLQFEKLEISTSKSSFALTKGLRLTKTSTLYLFISRHVFNWTKTIASKTNCHKNLFRQIFLNRFIVLCRFDDKKVRINACLSKSEKTASKQTNKQTNKGQKTNQTTFARLN